MSSSLVPGSTGDVPDWIIGGVSKLDSAFLSPRFWQLVKYPEVRFIQILSLTADTGKVETFGQTVLGTY